MMRMSEKVLELARWAPSGDNTQPWRFEVRSDHEILVHGYDTRAHCVYDLDGAASQFAHGAFLETVAIAATSQDCRAEISMVSASPSGHIVYRVALVPDPNMAEDPLVASIRERTVQRRPMSTQSLAPRRSRRSRMRPSRTGSSGWRRWVSAGGWRRSTRSAPTFA
jgi:nitroreductase